GDDAGQIRKLTEVLTRASHRLAETMYQQPGDDGHGGGSQSGRRSGGQAHAGAADDDVVDADFQEVA
ncbi:MAG: molecular chaperone DnaK, partial [Desulfosarcina sp.]